MTPIADRNLPPARRTTGIDVARSAFAHSLVGALLLMALAPVSWAREASTVEAVRSRRQNVSRFVRLPGSLEPWDQVAISSRVSGYVAMLAVDRGDRVAAGEVLVAIDAPELERDVSAAEADVIRAQAEAGLADALLAQLRASWEIDASSVSAQELAVAEAEARVTAAEVVGARARLSSLSAMLELTVLRAPFAGVVTRRDVSPGALVTAGDSRSSLVTLVRDDRLRAVVDVPELESANLFPGRVARLTVRSTGRFAEGRVSRLAGRLDSSTRTLRVEIDVENAEHRMRAGSFVDVQLEVETRNDAVVVPASAVLRAKQDSAVFVLVREGGAHVARRREVSTGVEESGVVEILGGLEPGELVVHSAAAASEGESYDTVSERASW